MGKIKLYFIYYMSIVLYIALADEVRHKAVLRLVVYVRRRTDLLYLAFAHHYHTVAQSQCLFLIVRHVDKRDAQLLVQLLK